MSAANACWIVLCKCMLDIKCSVLRGWSCAITKSFEFWLRTVEKMGSILSQPFPTHIASTGKQPDGVMWSDKLKMVMWIELTSPWEENMTT